MIRAQNCNFDEKEVKAKVNKQGFEPNYKSSALSTELSWLVFKG